MASPDQIALTTAGKNTGDFDASTTRALISEIELLIDFIAGQPTHRLKDLEIPEPSWKPSSGTPQPKVQAAAVIERIEELKDKFWGANALTASEVAFLRLANDDWCGWRRRPQV